MKYDYIILGGGPAGLAMAFYAQKHKKSFLILEKENKLGGNAITFKHGQYLYDSGAHRWHNVYPEVTQDLKILMGEHLKKIRKPSAISYKGKKIRFPLEIRDLIKNLPLIENVQFGLSYLFSKKSNFNTHSFAHYIIKKYGTKASDAFIWKYTEKLWGESPAKLLKEVSGKRLSGLDIKTLVVESDENLDGSFYYPDLGIGMIFDFIIKDLPSQSVRSSVNIESIEWVNEKITKIHLQDETLDTTASQVINTLAPHTFLNLSRKNEICDTQKMIFRDLYLLFIEINAVAVSPFASLYFPHKDVIFTRIVEPKNRSHHMSPKDKTSLVIEIPYFKGDAFDIMNEDERIQIVIQQVIQQLGITKDLILSTKMQSIPNAYPVLSLNSAPERNKYKSSIANIKNLKLLGRNATFSYLHLHDLFQEAKRLTQN